MTDLQISEVRFVVAPAQYQATGLIGWATCVMDGSLGLALGVRTTREGRWTLSFPARIGGDGQLHDQAWPVDQKSRDAIETQVLGELRRRGRLP
jgi:hypothetical protein